MVTPDNELAQQSGGPRINWILWYLVATTVFFLGIGLANLYSADAGAALFDAQLRNVAIGICIFVIVGWLVPLRVLSASSYFIALVTALALVSVLVLGYSAGGAQRWINLGFLRFQPSEFAKVAVIMAIARFFYNHRNLKSFTLRDLAPILGFLAVMFGLIFMEPDFGTAGMCLIIGIAQLIFIRIEVSRRMIGVLLVVSLSVAAIGWNFWLRPYQRQRIMTLVDPNGDPSGAGYNSQQSLVAIGSGQKFGKGFSAGTQARLQFLPARQTDFIFSVFAEEHGFNGCLVVVFLFTSIAYLSLELARQAKSLYQSVLATGVGAFIFLQFIINVAMVLGIFPVVGMPLPFFSYGGSAIISVCFAMGLLIAVARYQVRH